MSTSNRVLEIVDFHMETMPLRQLIDSFSDDHFGDIPMERILARARINMERHYKSWPPESLEEEWSRIQCSPEPKGYT